MRTKLEIMKLYNRAMDSADIAENKGDTELRNLWVSRAMDYRDYYLST